MKKTLSEDLRLKLDALPTDPGVYIMKRSDGQIIYVGKAKNLRHRVRSYFRTNDGDGRRQFKALVRNIADLDYIVTGTEQEALILEATQIKAHKPRYNILLKDDKKYPYIRITNEPFPRIYATRDIVRDGSRYLGPYSNVRAMHTTLDMLRKVFPVRSCDFQLPKNGVRLCIEYHIKRCEGPCEKLVDEGEYKKTIDGSVHFLRGQNSEVIKGLQQQMADAAEAMRFEEAARFRDQLKALESMRARQKVVFDDEIDRDVLGLARADDEACCSVLEVREGRLLGKKHHFLGGVMESSNEDVFSAFMQQFYLQNDFVPSQIHLPIQLADADELASWLSAKAEGRVELATPQRGAKAQMLEMAQRNAVQMLAERSHKREMRRDRVPQSIYALQRDLQLDTLPRRIEGIDISTFQGAHSVGSLVCFIDGQAKRSQYRYFKIKELEQPDDYASIYQAVHRRFRGLHERGEAFPDLLLIDGGKGQLASAVGALRELGIAKRFEEVFLPGEAQPRILPKTSASLRLLQTLRDEAHRFALKNHRDQRAKSTLTSALDDIPGIGPKKRNALLKTFGSVKRIAATPLEEITAIPGFSQKQAGELLAYLNGSRDDQGKTAASDAAQQDTDT
mgnify:FL=1